MVKGMVLKEKVLKEKVWPWECTYGDGVAMEMVIMGNMWPWGRWRLWSRGWCLRRRCLRRRCGQGRDACGEHVANGLVEGVVSGMVLMGKV